MSQTTNVPRTIERAGFVLAAGLAALAAFTGYRLLQSTAATWMIWSLFGSLGVLAVMFTVRIMHTRNAKYICMAMGVPLLLASFWLYNWRSEQVDTYNQAMELLNKRNPTKEDVAKAQKLLEESSQKYAQEAKRSQFWSLVLPTARRDVEARNHNHRGVIHVQNRKIKEAVQEFFSSCQFNSGNRFLGLSAEDAARWENDAKKPKANLEKLYQMGQADGRAKGKQGRNGQPQPGPDRDPGKDPSNSNGKKPPGKL
jgi:hypothetical protein